MAKRRNIFKGISQEVSRRAQGEVTGARELAKSRFRTRLVSIIPIQFQWIVPYLETFRFGTLEEDEETGVAEAEIAVAEPPKVAPIGVDFSRLYPLYRCPFGNPLVCEKLQQTDQIQTREKYCLECGFPATLPDQSEIRGSRGRYRVERLLTFRGMGRLYRGMQVTDSQPVVIKEYLLPRRYFNQAELRQRQQTFELVAGVSLADGRSQDFRLSQPWDAIADFNEERCYLVSKGNLELYPTLGDYLANIGAMTPIQVYHILNQVLQTLEFLHTQKLRLPSGLVQAGLAHGNLNLNSLLIAKNPLSSNHNGRNGTALKEADFLIYVSDLSLWEHLFNPPTSEPLRPTQAQDLKDLGLVAFYLLKGRMTSPVTGQLLNPKDDLQWGEINLGFKGFIQRLLGISLPFESAAIARQELLKLPQNLTHNSLIIIPETEPEEVTKTPRLLLLLLALLGLLILAGLIWKFLPRNRGTLQNPLICCINQVPALPSGSFNYTAEKDGTGRYLMLQENLISKNQTLEIEIENRQPKMRLHYKPSETGESALEKVKTGQVDFAITSLIQNLDPRLSYQEIAYDGLVVFVNFSYAQRQNSLPDALKGQISFADLRNLYTGKITNWKQLGGPDLPIQLYLPADDEAIAIFEQKVLQDPNSIQAFRDLRKTDSAGTLITSSTLPQFPTFELLRRVIQDFEDNEIGAIGFDTLSKVFGQCSVYPLAIKNENNPPIQALNQDNHQPITPQTDLCNDKGSYQANFEVFKQNTYPLAYPVTVVYPRDNSRPPAGRKFAELLRTEEGQQLLNKTGVVPLYRLQKP